MCLCVCVVCVCKCVCVFSKVRWEGGGMETGAEAETVQNHCCRVQHDLDSHFFRFQFFILISTSLYTALLVLDVGTAATAVELNTS